ncbi:MAG: hypothetical protein K0R57_3977 [Paenibacillaceae bacterium]|jgi:hypothetical protein|nr:hypothetical protein [Paenibacillaceae bacterium]
MRQSVKEAIMLQMQGECAFGSRESGVIFGEAARLEHSVPAITGGHPARNPGLKPGR